MTTDYSIIWRDPSLFEKPAIGGHLGFLPLSHNNKLHNDYLRLRTQSNGVHIFKA